MCPKHFICAIMANAKSTAPGRLECHYAYDYEKCKVKEKEKCKSGDEHDYCMDKLKRIDKCHYGEGDYEECMHVIHEDDDCHYNFYDTYDECRRRKRKECHYAYSYFGEHVEWCEKIHKPH